MLQIVENHILEQITIVINMIDKLEKYWIEENGEGKK
jgi:hypothetical protein